ncbi:MAG: nucleoside hydrolase [Pelagibacterium sp. SCN 63-23]|nr:MAG: nucleoside hydrolase [Pelagibacterium sp. SCN 63-23]
MSAPQAAAPQKIIIDTDPGIDDAVAILLALASPEIEVLGIVAVGGNVSIESTQANARKICELAGRLDIGVFAGSARSLGSDQPIDENCHGVAGLGTVSLPEPTMPLGAQHGVDFIVDTVMQSEPGSITICALGPLTNLALALLREPLLFGRIGRIVFMGGSVFRGGNVTAVAEFNIHQDPIAADIVFRSGIPLVMVPLDVTHKTLVNADTLARFATMRSRTGQALASMLDFYERFDRDKYGAEGGPLHDPNVIAYLLRPQLYRGQDRHLAAETKSALTMGMTVVDWWKSQSLPANAHVLTDVDGPAFFTLLLERIGRLK